MDLRTGKIIEANNDLSKLKHMVEVSGDEITEKQKKLKQVSLHDNKSKLGKKLQKKRKELRYSQMNRNQKRNLRNKLKKR